MSVTEQAKGKGENKSSSFAERNKDCIALALTGLLLCLKFQLKVWLYFSS